MLKFQLLITIQNRIYRSTFKIMHVMYIIHYFVHYKRPGSTTRLIPPPHPTPSRQAWMEPQLTNVPSSKMQFRANIYVSGKQKTNQFNTYHRLKSEQAKHVAIEVTVMFVKGPHFLHALYQLEKCSHNTFFMNMEYFTKTTPS